jgi:predicted flap endonuclease-1-like 5' DNA nuclease
VTFDTNTLIIVGGIAALVLLIILFLARRGGSKEIERKPREEGYVASTERPYMKARAEDGPQGNSIADEISTAATDVAGQVIGVEARSELPGAIANPDNLELLKGVGPKFAARLNELGIARFDQLAALSGNEIKLLDGKLGPFKGRLTRDRVTEQASHLARGDVDGFEEKFGKLGG